MAKILYAAKNSSNAKIQLYRFLNAMQGTKHQIKIAAYKSSSPQSISIDWTLDALLNIYNPEVISLYNDNLNIYYDQVKNYSPDLIISDLEYFTSYIANILNIPIWQCSSSLINYALSEKYNLGLFKYYAHSLNRITINTQGTVNLIDNANYNFIYSHFGDTINPPKIQSNFEWIRPYHQIGKDFIMCQHYIVAGLSNNNKNIYNTLKKYKDSVAFTEFEYEEYKNTKTKSHKNYDEYFCNLKNSSIFICEGQSSFLADAFYNGKYSLIYPDYTDRQSIVNSMLSNNLKLGKIMSNNEDVSKFEAYYVEPKLNGSIKYLHEKINEL